METSELANYDIIMRRLIMERKQNLMESYIYSDSIKLTEDEQEDLMDFNDDSILQLRLFGVNELYGLLLLLRNAWGTSGKMNPEFFYKNGWSYKVEYKDDGLYFVVPVNDSYNWRIMQEIGGYAKIVTALTDNIDFWAKQFPEDKWIRDFKQLVCMEEMSFEFDFKNQELRDIFLVKIAQTAVKSTYHYLDGTKIKYTAPGYILLIIIDIIRQACDQYGIGMPFDEINLINKEDNNMSNVETVEKLGGEKVNVEFTSIMSFEDLQKHAKESGLVGKNPEITVGVVFSDNYHQDGQFEEITLKDSFENDKAAYRSFKCNINGKVDAETERVEEAWDNDIVDPGCNYAPIAVYIGIKNGNEKAVESFETAWVGSNMERFKEEAVEVFSEFALLQVASEDWKSKDEELNIRRETSQAVKAYIGSYRKITDNEESVLNDYDLNFNLYTVKEHGSALDTMVKMAQAEG